MIYKTEQISNDETCVIYEFYRNTNGSRSVKKITDFKPYIFCDEECPIEQWEGVLRVDDGFTSIENTKVKKVTLKTPSIVKALRIKVEDIGFKTWESDIRFHNRYTIDKVSKIKDAKLKICNLDIETDCENGVFPNIDIANEEITLLGIKIDNDVKTWALKFKKEQEVNADYVFDSEKEMLNHFMNYFDKAEVDVLTAWNLIEFDLIYIINRCIRLGVDYKRLSPLRIVKVDEFKNRKQINIKGLVTLDLLDAYKLYRKYGNQTKLESYSLDFVSNFLLGKTKTKLEHKLEWYWRNDINTLIKYNKQDVALLEEINNHCKVIDFFDDLRRKCHVQFDDVYSTVKMIDGFLINRLKTSIILPNGNKIKDGEKYKGAFVMEPVAGLYDNIICEDVAGMYPSIITNFNISFETISEEGTIKLPTGTSFIEKEGIIPMFIKELLKERKDFKKLRDLSKTKRDKDLYEQRQWSSKILANAFYGYLGYQGSRLYKREVANTITGMGQYLIGCIKNWTEECGNKVIYQDTDSAYIVSNKKSNIDVVLEGNSIANYINVKLDQFSKKICGKNNMFIEFEKVLEKLLFTTAKKAYAYRMLWDSKKKFNVDKETHIQGFSAKRSDSNKIGRTTQISVIDMIIDGAKKVDVVSYLKKVNSDMKTRKFKDVDIGFPKGITKDLSDYNPPGPIIKGSYFSNNHYNTNYGRGSKPKFVWVTNVSNKPEYQEIPIKTVEGIKLKRYKVESVAYDTTIPKEVNIDWQRMSESTLKRKLENLFSAVGWEWENLDMISLYEVQK